MNFSVVADDHLLGVTHVIRGKDHIANTRRQRYIYDHFGWKVPVYRHYGRMGIEGVVLSTSQMRLGITEGKYTGWDDIHLGTLRALARRGITRMRSKTQCLRSVSAKLIFRSHGIISMPRIRSLSTLWQTGTLSVPDPCAPWLEVLRTGSPKRCSIPAMHRKGPWALSFEGAVMLPGTDIVPGAAMVRLKDLFNVKITWDGTVSSFAYGGDALADARAVKAHIIQWLPGQQTLPCTLVTMEGELKGVCEPAVAKEKGNVVQFERIGFVRIDEVDRSGVRAYFTHT